MKYYMSIYKQIMMQDYNSLDNMQEEYYTLDMVGSYEEILGRVTTNPRQDFMEYTLARKGNYIYTLREMED